MPIRHGRQIPPMGGNLILISKSIGKGHTVLAANCLLTFRGPSSGAGRAAPFIGSPRTPEAHPTRFV